MGHMALSDVYAAAHWRLFTISSVAVFVGNISLLQSQSIQY